MAKAKAKKKAAPKKAKKRGVKVPVSKATYKILKDLGFIDEKSGDLNAVGNAAILEELNRMMEEPEEMP